MTSRSIDSMISPKNFILSLSPIAKLFMALHLLEIMQLITNPYRNVSAFLPLPIHPINVLNHLACTQNFSNVMNFIRN